MRIYLAGLLALAALATLSVSSVEARGRRCGGGSCGSFQSRNTGCGVFQGGHIFGHRHVHTAQCGVNGCNAGGVVVQGTTWTGPNPQIVEEGTTSPQSAPAAIQVRDSQGRIRIYYLIPQNQYEKLTSPK